MKIIFLSPLCSLLYPDLSIPFPFTNLVRTVLVLRSWWEMPVLFLVTQVSLVLCLVATSFADCRSHWPSSAVYRTSQYPEVCWYLPLLIPGWSPIPTRQAKCQYRRLILFQNYIIHTIIIEDNSLCIGIPGYSIVSHSLTLYQSHCYEWERKG